MKKLAMVFILACTAVLHAQTAKVVALSPEDAATAKQLYDAQAALDKRKADFEASVKTKYLTVKKGDKDWSDQGVTFSINNSWDKKDTKPLTAYRAGWGYGDYVYSDDFKYIVPKPPTYQYSNVINSCVQNIPAYMYKFGTEGQ